LRSAKRKQGKMKKSYGYKPGVYRVGNPRTGKATYVVIKPRGLKRMR